MALDSRLIIASDLQVLLRDKDTGLPLRNGVLTFYKDEARTELKPVYKLSGSPPNYSYVQLENPIALSSIGTFQDPQTGDDIVPYYFPYEGTIDDSSGDVELYYVTVESEDGVNQFTREAWPNFINTESTSSDFTNYVPNGQFLFHTNVPLTDTTKDAGEITQPSTPVAQGGWTFDRPVGSTAKDIVTFTAFNAYVSDPSASPQYAININCETPSAGDSFKDLRIKFTDVNKFASTTQKYTFAFSGQSNESGSLSAALILIKNYGSGGSTTTETPLGNLTIPAGGYSVIQTAGGFVFGVNSGKTIGDGSYLQLAVRFPSDTGFDVALTDYILTPEAVDIELFPQTTDGQFSNQALIAGAPNPDGSDLYLRTRLTATGLVYDHSEIGEIIDESNISQYVDSLHPTSNKMLTDGNQYPTAGYSPLGIPFARLQGEYWDPNVGMPVYGTGKSYFVAVLAAATNQLILANNSPGVVTATADGILATGFAFRAIHTGIAPASGYFCTSIQPTTTEVYIVNTEPGDVGAGNAHTAPVIAATARVGSPVVNQISSFDFTGVVAGGQYFTFQTSNGGVRDWYLWFRIDGVGADPAIGGRTGILVDTHASDSITVIAQKTTAALNNWQATSILTAAASGITAGHYFTANAITPGGDEVPFYVWYKKDGVGTDPAPVGKEGIEVDIVTGDTAIQVAQKTQIAINMRYFAAPNYADLFFRSQGAGVNRYPYTFGSTEQTGSLQLDDNLQHDHGYNYPTSTDSEAGGGAAIDVIGSGAAELTTETGGTESRPVNVYVNRAVRY